MSRQKDAATTAQEPETAGAAAGKSAKQEMREDNVCCCAPYCTCPSTASQRRQQQQRHPSARPRGARTKPWAAETDRLRLGSYRYCDYCLPERGDLAEAELRERQLHVQRAKANEHARWQQLADAAERARVSCGAYRRNTSELLRARRNAQYRRCLDAEYYARRRALQDELACRRDELSHLRRAQPLTRDEYRDPYGELYSCGPVMAAHTTRREVWPCATSRAPCPEERPHTTHDARREQRRQEQACQTLTRDNVVTNREAPRPPTPCPCHCHRRISTADAGDDSVAASNDEAVWAKSPAAKRIQSSLHEHTTRTPRPEEPSVVQPPSTRPAAVHESCYCAWPSCTLQSPRFGRKVFITDEEYLRRRSQYLTAWEEAGMVRRICDTSPHDAAAGKGMPLSQRTPKWRTLPCASQDGQQRSDT